MANNIAVSITADVADLQVKRAIMSAELKTATKDLNTFAKEAATGGSTDKLRTDMLAAGSSVTELKNKIGSLDTELKQVTGSTGGTVSAQRAFIAALKEEAATAGMTRAQLAAYKAEKMGVAAEAAPLVAAIEAESVAMKASSAAHVSARAYTEPLVMIHEALSGNFRRLAGSAMIEAQAMAGAEKTASAFKAVLSPTGLAIGGVAAFLIAGAVAADQYENAQAKLVATAIGVGAASGLTAAQLEAAGAAAASWSGQTVGASTEAAEAFASAGIRSQQEITVLSGSIQTYAALTGQKAAEATKALAEAMKDPIRAAQELHEQLGILDGAQLEQIRTMTEAGDKTGAVAMIVQAYTKRINEAHDAGVGVNGTLADMKNGLSVAWEWFGKAAAAAATFADQLERIQRGDVTGAVGLGGDLSGKAANAQRSAARQRQLHTDSAAGQDLVDASPEAAASEAKQKLRGGVQVLQRRLAADRLLDKGGDHAAAIARDTAALTDYTRALTTYLPPAEKAHQLAQLDAKLALAKKGHDKKQVAALTSQRETVSMAGEVKSPGEVAQAAADHGAIAEDRTGGAKKGKKGPSIVSEWQEQLRAQEVASKDYFKDETADELAFWTGKLELVKKGGKDWIEVQGHVFELSRTMARQDYQNHLAALNEKLAADHANWDKEQADWTEKLDFIKSKYGEQSREYKHELTEQDRARREHDKQELADTERGIGKAMQLLKAKSDAQAKVQETDAHAAIVGVKDHNAGKPFGEISTAASEGAINAKLNQAKLADIERLHAAEAAMLDKAITDAAAKYHGDESQYQGLIDAKKKADEDYANHKAELESQARLQSIQSIEAVKQAYHGYVDGLAGKTVQGFSGMISGQETWRQAAVGLYGQVARTFEQSLERMLSNWIVDHLLMTAAQKTQLAAQLASHATGEVAKTAATTVGGEARVVATASATGQAAAITGTHNMKEITSHAATAAAAAYHAMAAIPVVGPILGAAAAAATFTAVEGYGMLASFAVGTNEVPNDMIAQIHAGERIVPKADNQAIMDAVRGAGGRDRRGGDMHLTYAPQLAGDTPSFRQQLSNHSSDLISMIRRATRDGAFA